MGAPGSTPLRSCPSRRARSTPRRRRADADRRAGETSPVRPTASPGTKSSSDLDPSMPENPFSCEVCDDCEAVFWVYERYTPDAGGAVELDTPLCRECVEDVGPRHLEDAYANYVFRIEPVAEAFGMSTI